MQVNSDLKSTLNQQLQSNLTKQERVESKNNAAGLKEAVSNLKNNESQIGTPEVKGKTASKLDELNKQKVTPELLETTVKELKKDKSSDSNAEVQEVQKQKPAKKKIFDPRDKNKDGKVSSDEKHSALSSDKKLQDKNRDGVISESEKQATQKKTTGLIKDVINELKKDEDFKEIKPEQFKGISKMINTELIDSKESNKINRFLEN